MHTRKLLTLSATVVLLVTLVPAAAAAVPPAQDAGAGHGVPQKDGPLVPLAGAVPAAVPSIDSPKLAGALPLSLSSRAYATELINGIFGYLDLDVPGSFVLIGPYAPAIYAGDFIGDDLFKVYAIRYDNRHLITLETMPLAETDVGILPAPPSGHYRGMAYDPATGNTYVSSCGGSISYLFLLDVATPTTTLIGQITNSPCTSALAADDSGNLWGADTTNDTLLSIDKSTGAGTVIGDLGFSSAYEEGMDWDSASDQLYLAAYNFDTSVTELRIVNTVTGNTTLVGQIGGTMLELGWLAIAPRRPEIEVTPSSLSQELRPNETVTQELSICNVGTAELNWIMHEVSPALELDSIEGTLPAAPAMTLATAPGTTQPAVNASPDVLLVAADDATTMEALLEPYGDLASVAYYDARLATPSLAELQAFDVVVTWSNSFYADPTAIGDVLADYVDAGGKVVNLAFAFGTGSRAMAGRFMTENYTAMNGTIIDPVPTCMNTYNAEHPIMAGVLWVCDKWRVAGTYLTSGSSEIAQWSDGRLFVAAKDNQTVVTINGYVGDDYEWTGQMPDLLHNAILWLAGEVVDLPWLSEDPTGDWTWLRECVTVTATFDSAGLAPGDYLGGLLVWSDDPDQPRVTIPVSLTVAPHSVYLPIVNKLNRTDK